ncbi:MAG: HEAT repeat domain-containing protein [Phycisphaerae bacterium]|nr:HEAT repeat domain-containing protein [Phycisphaerae bacterium]
MRVWQRLVLSGLLALLSPVLPACAAATDAADRVVAGRTLSDWGRDLSSENRFVRLRAVKTLGAFGSSATALLIAALDDPAPGVRYWAASHLGSIGKPAAKAVPRLVALKSDTEHTGVAMAAAFALCTIKGVDGYLGFLADQLESPERGMACSAAEFLGRLGTAAAAAVPALETAYKRHNRKPGQKGPSGADYHVRGAVQNALRKIQPGWKPES